MISSFSKPLLSFIFLFWLATTNVSAQLVIRQGDHPPQHYLKAGYGFLQTATPRNSDVRDAGLNDRSGTGPFYLKYEYNADYDLTIGISMAYEKIKSTLSQYYSGSAAPLPYNYQSTSFLFRMNYIMRPDKKIQPYFGAALGVRFVNEKGTAVVYSDSYTYYYYNFSYGGYKATDYNDSYTMLGGELTCGINCFIRDGWGAYAEAGFAKSVIQIGLIKTFGN